MPQWNFSVLLVLMFLTHNFANALPSIPASPSSTIAISTPCPQTNLTGRNVVVCYTSKIAPFSVNEIVCSYPGGALEQILTTDLRARSWGSNQQWEYTFTNPLGSLPCSINLMGIAHKAGWFSIYDLIITADAIFNGCDNDGGRGGLKYLTYPNGWVNKEWVVEVKGEYGGESSPLPLREACSISTWVG